MKTAPVLGLSMLLASSAAYAATDKFNITPAEHAACDGDAVSLCAATYPDQDKLLACMKVNRDQLSPACHEAFLAGLKRRGMRL